MAYQEVSRVEIKEVLRQWQAGFSQRAIARATGLSRTTVHKYILAAEQAGLHQGGTAPTEEQLTGLAPLESGWSQAGRSAHRSYPGALGGPDPHLADW
jgi:hypothetical protein